ncbi:MAG: hypothetical protein MJ237_08165, partial [bacterium]|nr:hypothetical protein [bacterium]
MANDIIDSIREFFGGVSQDDVTKAITKLKHDLKFLKAATEGNLVCGNDKIDFNTAFKILRGVEFSENNFKTCQETSAKYIDVSSKNVAVNSFIDKFKTYSSLRGADGIDLNNPAKFNETFLEFFKTLGLNNKTDINKFLEDFCNANKNEEALKKYGSKLKLIKLNEAHKKYYKQDYAVMRQTPSGAWEPLTPEQAELMSDYLIGKKLVPLKASLLGLSENSSNEDCEKYVEKCKTKYLEAFKNAYGEEDVNELADKYIQGQMKGMECFQVTTALVMMAATVLTDGLASAFLTGAMIAQPLTLIENLTNGDGATWNDVEAHGKLLLENLPWFALGSLGGKIGDEVRAVCKLKGLQSITKQAGKSLDKIMTSVATKADPNLSKLLKKVDILTQTSGVTTEVALDLVTTKCLQEQGLTTYDWVMSFAGALQGTVIQKKLAKVCDNQTRVRLLQESFKELNLNTAEATMIISKMELPIILDDATVTAPKTDGQKPQMGL